MPKYCLLILLLFPEEYSTHRINSHKTSISTAGYDCGVKVACRESKSYTWQTSESEAGEETAERISAQLLIFLGSYDGEEGIGKGEGSRGDASAAGENKVCLG